MEHKYCVIMAGGRGERFWPLSTRRVPKPFVKLIGEKSLIQMTVERLLEIVPRDHIIVVLGEEHIDVARRQLEDLHADQFLVEPAGRDTAPCIGFAATVLKRKDPEALMIVLPADHFIPDKEAFARTISGAAEAATSGDYLVTTGIKPSRPETGYGYIYASQAVEPGLKYACYKVSRFVEKPDAATALNYLAEGNYYWNAGIFVWRASVVLRGMARHMPELHEGIRTIDEAIGQGDRKGIETVFKDLPKISIDYGLMEKADNVVMVKAEFAWDDVGTWSSVRRVMDLDDDGNYLRGEPLCIDTKDCLVYADNIRIGTIGISNLIVVASKEGVLVCDPSRDQEIRQLARMMDEK